MIALPPPARQITAPVMSHRSVASRSRAIAQKKDCRCPRGCIEGYPALVTKSATTSTEGFAMRAHTRRRRRGSTESAGSSLHGTN
jgi:hypothetical protein